MEPNYQSRLGSTGAMQIQADSQPTATYDENGRPGWSYTKLEGNEKFNWYFYSGAHENLTCKDVATMSFNGSIDAWSNQTSEAPFFTLYTKMKMDGSDAGSWYHSRHAYALHKDSQLIRAGEKCVFYALEEPSHDYGLRKIPFRNRIDTGSYDGDNEILTIALQSDSAASQCSVYAEKLGLDCKPFMRGVDKTCVNIKLMS